MKQAKSVRAVISHGMLAGLLGLSVLLGACKDSKGGSTKCATDEDCPGRMVCATGGVSVGRCLCVEGSRGATCQLDSDCSGVTSTCVLPACICGSSEQPECGNGILEEGEECENSMLMTSTWCADIGAGVGRLHCDYTTCTYDTSQCRPAEGTICDDAFFHLEGMCGVEPFDYAYAGCDAHEACDAACDLAAPCAAFNCYMDPSCEAAVQTRQDCLAACN